MICGTPMNEKPTPSRIPAASRFIGGIFGLVFAGIGITVIISMWFGEMGEDVPTFARIFASFIALAFVAMGGTLAATSFFISGMMNPQHLIEQARRLQESASSAQP